MWESLKTLGGNVIITEDEDIFRCLLTSLGAFSVKFMYIALKSF